MEYFRIALEASESICTKNQVHGTASPRLLQLNRDLLTLTLIFTGKRWKEEPKVYYNSGLVTTIVILQRLRDFIMLKSHSLLQFILLEGHRNP